MWPQTSGLPSPADKPPVRGTNPKKKNAEEIRKPNLDQPFCGLVFKRWGMNGVFTLGLTALLAAGGLIALVTWQREWGAIGRWLIDQPTGLIAGWPALLAVLLAGAGYLAIRRATP